MRQYRLEVVVSGGEVFSYVAMAAEVLEQLDLAQGALGENLLAKDIGDLFDGNTFVALVVYGSTG